MMPVLPTVPFQLIVYFAFVAVLVVSVRYPVTGALTVGTVAACTKPAMVWASPTSVCTTRHEMRPKAKYTDQLEGHRGQYGHHHPLLRLVPGQRRWVVRP